MIQPRDKYTSLKQLSFIKLRNEHFRLMKELQTYQSELKNFLIEDAIRSANLSISTTYLVFDSRQCSGKKPKLDKSTFLLGYITITNDSINLGSKLKEHFREKGINYKSLPSLKIGRLCVDDRYSRKGLGSLFVAFCVKKVLHLNEQVSCRFITLDAMRKDEKEKDSLHFYLKMGFNVLEHKNKNRTELMAQKSGTTPMFLDVYPLLKKRGIVPIL